MQPRTDKRLVGALARRRFKSDHGFTDTLRPQSARGSHHATVINYELVPRCETICHCQRTIVPTTWQHVRDGVGESCGRPNCQPKDHP